MYRTFPPGKELKSPSPIKNEGLKNALWESNLSLSLPNEKEILKINSPVFSLEQSVKVLTLNKTDSSEVEKTPDDILKFQYILAFTKPSNSCIGFAEYTFGLLGSPDQILKSCTYELGHHHTFTMDNLFNKYLYDQPILHDFFSEPRYSMSEVYLFKHNCHKAYSYTHYEYTSYVSHAYVFKKSCEGGRVSYYQYQAWIGGFSGEMWMGVKAWPYGKSIYQEWNEELDREMKKDKIKRAHAEETKMIFTPSSHYQRTDDRFMHPVFEKGRNGQAMSPSEAAICVNYFCTRFQHNLTIEKLPFSTKNLNKKLKEVLTEFPVTDEPSETSDRPAYRYRF